MSDPVKRQYRSAKRAAAAAETRAAIRRAATELFVERGYGATTLREVAQRAGVGERTLYDAFPGKAALFGHTLGVATTGDEEPVPVRDRPEVRKARELDAKEALAASVDYTTDLLERAGDLIMVSVEAAGTDADMRAAADAGAAATHRVHLELTTGLADRGALRAGLSATDAADIMFGLASPHLHQLLRRYRGWTVEHYRKWLTETLIAQLL